MHVEVVLRPCSNTTRNLKNTYTDVRKNLPVGTDIHIMFAQVCVFHCWDNVKILPKISSSSLVFRPANLALNRFDERVSFMIFLWFMETLKYMSSFALNQIVAHMHSAMNETQIAALTGKYSSRFAPFPHFRQMFSRIHGFSVTAENHTPRLKNRSRKVSPSSFRWYLEGHVDVHLNGLHLVPTRQRPATPTGTCEPELEEFWTWFCADKGIIMARTGSLLAISPGTVRPSSSILIHHFAPLHITRRRFALAPNCSEVLGSPRRFGVSR